MTKMVRCKTLIGKQRVEGQHIVGLAKVQEDLRVVGIKYIERKLYK